MKGKGRDCYSKRKDVVISVDCHGNVSMMMSEKIGFSNMEVVIGLREKVPEWNTFYSQ